MRANNICLEIAEDIGYFSGKKIWTIALEELYHNIEHYKLFVLFFVKEIKLNTFNLGEIFWMFRKQKEYFKVFTFCLNWLNRRETDFSTLP